MAIETRIQPRQTLQNGSYSVICLALAIWGWYDYSVKIPTAEAAFAEYTAAAERNVALEQASKQRPLTDPEKAEYNSVQTVLAKYKEKPLYIVGCGVMGVPFFVYSQWQLSRKRFRLGDDGSFECNEDRFTAQQITGIDMSRWMAKSIATLEVDGGRRIELDDFKYKGVEEIVAHFAARFEPGKWTSDARPHGDPKSRDTKAKREAAAAAAIAAGERPQGSDNPPNA